MSPPPQKIYHSWISSPLWSLKTEKECVGTMIILIIVDNEDTGANLCNQIKSTRCGPYHSGIVFFMLNLSYDVTCYFNVFFSFPFFAAEYWKIPQRWWPSFPCLPSFHSWILCSISYPLTAWKVSKYGVISGPYFPVFGLNTGKYGPEITSYLDTFHAVPYVHMYCIN